MTPQEQAQQIVEKHPYWAAFFAWHCKDPWKLYTLVLDYPTLIERLKGWFKMFNPLNVMRSGMKLMAMAAVIVPLVEIELSGAPGSEKQAKAIEYMVSHREKIESEFALPKWASNVLFEPHVLELIVDITVKLANAAGDLLAKVQASGDAPPAAPADPAPAPPVDEPPPADPVPPEGDGTTPNG